MQVDSLAAMKHYLLFLKSILNKKKKPTIMIFLSCCKLEGIMEKHIGIRNNFVFENTSMSTVKIVKSKQESCVLYILAVSMNSLKI